MRPVWAVPFCSYAKEPHWVVAYIDPGNFVTMRNPKSKRVYIGKVLDILRQGKGNNGSITEADGVTGISALSLRVYRAILTHSVAVQLPSFHVTLPNRFRVTRVARGESLCIGKYGTASESQYYPLLSLEQYYLNQ